MSGRDVFWLVMRTGQRVTLVGLLFGLAAAYAGGRVVATRVFEMRAADPIVLIAACAIVAGVSMTATMMPAVRASRLDPLRVLRRE